jgi:hypothetical protein
MPRTLLLLLLATSAPAQTADDLVQRNLLAKGGPDAIKAIHSLRMTGKMQMGSLTADATRDALAPNQLRQTFTIQGMTQIAAYDGRTGWQISPFAGRRDPELLGEEDLRDIVEDADFTGPLIDPAAKGNRIEYLGKDTLDGDDVHRLKVTLKNGDTLYYYLDPETFLEVRVDRIQNIHGALRETFTEMGSYKKVAGVYMPFTLESGSKQTPNSRTKVTFTKIEANISIDSNEFHMPGGKK